MTFNKNLLLLGLLLIITIPGFSKDSDTPYEGWLKTETEHFLILYEPRDERAVREVISFCEEVYHSVTEVLKSYPKKIPLVIRGRIDTANGYYRPLPDQINLYVSSPSGPWLGSKSENWLKLLLTHELTHYVHLVYEKGLLAKLSLLFGPGIKALPGGFIPGWALEGITIRNETEFTRGGRGRNPFFEVLYKAPILEGQFFPYSKAAYSSIYPPSGRHYVAGYIFVDYLSRTYGPDIFGEINRRYYRFPFLGFDLALYQATGEKGFRLWRRMKEELEARYGNLEPDPAVETVTPDQVSNYYRPIKTEQGLLLYKRTPRYPSSLVLLDPTTGVEREVLSLALTDEYSYSCDSLGKRIVFAAYRNNWDHPAGETLKSDLFLYERESGTLVQLTHSGGFLQPTLSPQGDRVAAVKLQGSYSSLVEIDLSTGREKILFRQEESTVYTPVYSAQGDSLAFILNQRGIQDLWLLELVETGESQQRASDSNNHSRARPLTGPDSDGDYFPSFTETGDILFSSDRSGSLAVYLWEKTTGNIYLVQEDPVAAWSGILDKETLFYSSYSSKGYNLKRSTFSKGEKIALRLEEPPPPPVVPPAKQGILESAPYKDLPRFLFWLPEGSVKTGPKGTLIPSLGLGGLAYSILGNQSIFGTITFPYPFAYLAPDLLLNYTLSLGKPVFGFQMEHSYDYTSEGLFRQRTQFSLEGQYSLVSSFFLNQTTELSLTGSVSFLYDIISLDQFGIDALFSASQTLSYQDTASLQTTLGFQGGRAYRSPPSSVYTLKGYSGGIQAGMALPLSGNGKGGFFLLASGRVSIPGPLPLSGLSLDIKVSYTQREILGERYFYPRGFPDPQSQVLEGYLFFSGDYRFTITVPDLPLLGMLYLEGLGGNLFLETGLNWNIEDLTFEEYLFTGLEISFLIGYLQVSLPFSLGISLRIPYRDLPSFNPAEDIRPYISSSLLSLDILLP